MHWRAASKRCCAHRPGNTSASAAAYAARGGITCAVLVPQGKIAMGKLAQAVMHGAKIIQVDGNFDDCLELARKTTADFPTVALVNSVNPVRIEGQKTAAFEIVDALGARARRAFPAGRERGQHHRVLAGLPGVPPRRHQRPAAPDAGHAGRRCRSAGVGRTGEGTGDHRHGDPHRLPGVVGARGQAQQESNGRFVAATDDEILAAYHLVARSEGVFVEPASAASIAGLLKSVQDGWIAKGTTVVCTVTGNGLKDPDTALKDMPEVAAIPVDPTAVVEKLGLV